MCSDKCPKPDAGCEPVEPKGCREPSESKRCYELPSGGWVQFCQWPALRPLKLTTRKWRPLAGGKRRWWELADDWCVVLCGMQSTKRKVPDGKIVIPKGTVTDGASVPLPWLVSFLTFGLLRPTGILLIPSIVHDYAYKHGCLRCRNQDGTETCREISRADADWLFREMIRGISHTWFWAHVAWLAVRSGWLFCVKYAGKRIGRKTPFKEPLQKPLEPLDMAHSCATVVGMHPPPDIEQRIRILFGPAPAFAARPPDGSPYSAAAEVETVDISEAASLLAQFGNGRVAREPDPVAAADAWLDTPNPTFGGLCPRAFLRGTPKQRAFLDGVLSSLEDGAFS